MAASANIEPILDGEIPKLVPELDVTNLDESISFYALFGLVVSHARPEEGFAYLTLGPIHLMLQSVDGPGRRFRTAELQRPFGRGMNLQLEVENVRSVYEDVVALGHQPLVELEERWYRVGESEAGNLQFVVADPDGYLLRPFQDLGRRDPQPSDRG